MFCVLPTTPPLCICISCATHSASTRRQPTDYDQLMLAGRVFLQPCCVFFCLANNTSTLYLHFPGEYILQSLVIGPPITIILCLLHVYFYKPDDVLLCLVNNTGTLYLHISGNAFCEHSSSTHWLRLFHACRTCILGNNVACFCVLPTTLKLCICISRGIYSANNHRRSTEYDHFILVGLVFCETRWHVFVSCQQH